MGSRVENVVVSAASLPRIILSDLAG